VSSDTSSRHARSLIVGLQRQEPGAAARVLADYGRMLRGFLVEALDDPVEAEDVLQQTLTEIWRRGPSYSPERGSLATWMLLIARSRAIDHLRRRIPEPFDPTDMPDTVDPSTELELETLIERWRIAGLLAGLPHEESRVLALRFYRGLSQGEIAAHTHIPLGTVKMRMAHGLERLRLAIEQEQSP
jgi:RNA polymerase sigma-70 factor (ECF subfamily)